MSKEIIAANQKAYQEFKKNKNIQIKKILSLKHYDNYK